MVDKSRANSVYKFDTDVCREGFDKSGLVSKFGVIGRWYNKYARAITVFMVACILSVSGVLIASISTKTSAVSIEIQRQNQVIEEYNSQSIEMNKLLDKLQNPQTRVDDESFIDELIAKSQQVLNKFNQLIDLASNANTLSPQMVEFLDEQQALFESLGLDKQSKANWNTNHVITIKVIFWNVAVGYHFSPQLCADLKDLATIGAGISTLIAALASAFPPIAGIAAIVAAVLTIYVGVLSLGSSHYGCETYIVAPAILIPCL